jgi:cytosine/adenosine deaminase-related metal-dependent hydrolase
VALLIWGGVGVREAGAAPERDLAVCVEDGRIAAVDTLTALAARYPNADRFGGSQYLLMPALVNSHDHGRGIGTASLGIGDDILEVWLRGLASQPTISPYLAAAYDGIQLLRSGVTTTAHSHNPRSWSNGRTEADETLCGYRDVGIRAAFHPIIVDQNMLVYDDQAGFAASLPPDARAAAAPLLTRDFPSADDYFALCADLLRDYHDPHGRMAQIQVSPAGGQWCSDDRILRAVQFARQHNTRVQMHMLETPYQRQYAYRKWGKSFIAHLAEIGALGAWLTLAHMIWLDEGDFELLAAHGVGVAHNPSSNLRLRSGIADVPRMLKAGVKVGIGLDGHALDDDQDYLREMRLAWTLSNRPGASSLTVSSETILRMGTIDGAAITLGANAPLGRLAPDYLADMVLVDWDRARGAWSPEGYPPLEGVVDLLLHRAARGHVAHVMVNGEWVVRDGRTVRIDEDMIAAAIRDELASQGMDAPPAENPLIAHLRRFYAAWDDQALS